MKVQAELNAHLAKGPRKVSLRVGLLIEPTAHKALPYERYRVLEKLEHRVQNVNERESSPEENVGDLGQVHGSSKHHRE